jgi:hypothetical protein
MKLSLKLSSFAVLLMVQRSAGFDVAAHGECLQDLKKVGSKVDNGQFAKLFAANMHNSCANAPVKGDVAGLEQLGMSTCCDNCQSAYRICQDNCNIIFYPLACRIACAGAYEGCKAYCTGC